MILSIIALVGLVVAFSGLFAYGCVWTVNYAQCGEEAGEQCVLSVAVCFILSGLFGFGALALLFGSLL